ncbi:MAG TPA: recombinase family protein [Thermoanaerobaculia bacterium]|jgi:DNA invertase Pin-like site-specific DNA recombinase|nr:recombinase family protein [Thermoanaerobaculia bacterium]
MSRLGVAIYARTSAADHSRETLDQILAGLAAYAGGRGWEVVLECTDEGPFPEDRREGLRRLLGAVRAKAVQGVVVRSLSHLARSLRHLSDLGRLLAAQGVALIATEDFIDTTDPGGAIRWRDWLEISGRLDRELRAEAAKLARLRTPGDRWGRSAAVINSFELLTWWEGRGGRRPLSLRELARKLGFSQATTRKRLHALRAAGQVDDEARARALATRGGHRRGGRPANPLDDDALSAAWKLQLQAAHRRGAEPSLSAVARNLRVSRHRVRSRLQELGLLSEGTQSLVPQGAQEKDR